jgi:Protein of unknown function (DUF5131)
LAPSLTGGRRMGDKSSIERTEATWNPTTGCDRISRGCDHCYAELDCVHEVPELGAWLKVPLGTHQRGAGVAGPQLRVVGPAPRQQPLAVLDVAAQRGWLRHARQHLRRPAHAGTLPVESRFLNDLRRACRVKPSLVSESTRDYLRRSEPSGLGIGTMVFGADAQSGAPVSMAWSVGATPSPLTIGIGR